MSFPSLCPVRGRTLPDHRPPLFFQCLAMGPEPWGVPSTARMLSSYLFLCFFFMTCYVFSFVSEFSQNSSLYSLGIKSGKAPTLPARPSPELKSSHWSGCWLPQEWWTIFTSYWCITLLQKTAPIRRLQIDDLTQSDTFVTSTQTKTQNTAWTPGTLPTSLKSLSPPH